ncbi:Uncharacterized protein DAT39_012836, partial [Clarias magur]
MEYLARANIEKTSQRRTGMAGRRMRQETCEKWTSCTVQARLQQTSSSIIVGKESHNDVPFFQETLFKQGDADGDVVVPTRPDSR